MSRYFLLFSLLFVACQSDDARISGQLIGVADRPLYLERVVPTGAAVVDTVVTGGKGEFAFRVAIPDGEPTIFNLKAGGDIVPLLVSPRERVKVMSYGDVGRGYRVSGSAESELVWELHDILARGSHSLDSISTLFVTSDEAAREGLRRAYADVYYKTKRAQIGFIVKNSSSLAAVYALYQRLPGDEVLFNGDTDYAYYRMVADSVERRYPTSRYVAALHRQVEEQTRIREMAERIGNAQVSELNHPELELPNMYGQQVKLSEVASGRVTVVDFWSAATTEGALNNAEMRELWEEFEGRGLAVYQVSLDTSRPLWVNAVQDQRLPWTTVCDFRGAGGAAVGLWNVQSLPANFVLDRQGNIVGKNLYGEALREKIIKELGI